MSRWSETLDSHPIHATINQSSKWLEASPEEPDADLEEERRRLKKVLILIANTIEQTDAEFFPTGLLYEIDDHLKSDAFWRQLQAYSAAPSIDNLQMANDHITDLAQQVYQLAALNMKPESRKSIRACDDAFASFTKKMQKSAEKLKNEINKNQATLDDIKENTTSLEDTLGELANATTDKLSEWQTGYTEDRTSRAEEYSEAQIERAQKFEELVLVWKEKIENNTKTITKTHDDKLQATLDHFTYSGKKVLEDVNQKHRDVIKLHGLVGRDSVTGGYKNNADNEQKSANTWRITSMVFLSCAAIWLVVKYILGISETADGDINWADAITTTSLTAIFILIAGYASKQSKLHRDNETKMRWFELETAALDPFISDLPIEQQQSIKAELIRRLFGQQQNPVVKTVKLDDITVKTIVETLADKLSKV